MTFLEVGKSGRYFLWQHETKPKIRWPRKIYRELFLFIFFIFMTEEHVSFHFQQISSWTNRAFRMLFHFPESWEIRNFLLTGPNKANFDGSKYIFKSLFWVYFFLSLWLNGMSVSSFNKFSKELFTFSMCYLTFLDVGNPGIVQLSTPWPVHELSPVIITRWPQRPLYMRA